MLPRISRSLRFQYSLQNNFIKVNQYSSKVNTGLASFSRRGVDQVEYIKSEVTNNNFDWPTIKVNVLSKEGQLNEKNFEAVLLKILVNSKYLDAALSFANYLKSNSEELTLGSTNGLLNLYYVNAQNNKLSDDEKTFILDTYKSLYKKYKVLDYATCERLVRALCIIDECEKGLKVLGDIHQSTVPSHVAYSILIGAFFRNNKKKKALELITESIENRRPLLHLAFEEWINYILRKYKDKRVILKHLDEIYLHISNNYAVVDEKTAVILKNTFESLGWKAGFTYIRKFK